MIATCFSTGSGWYWPCLSSSTMRCAAGELRLRGPVEVGAELREGRELPVLGEVEPELARHLRMALICADPPTRETERPTFTAGRMPA